jgi:hypothetical protein
VNLQFCLDSSQVIAGVLECSLLNLLPKDQSSDDDKDAKIAALLATVPDLGNVLTQTVSFVSGFHKSYMAQLSKFKVDAKEVSKELKSLNSKRKHNFEHPDCSRSKSQ